LSKELYFLHNIVGFGFGNGTRIFFREWRDFLVSIQITVKIFDTTQ